MTADMAGWVGLRQWAKLRGVDRERLLRQCKKLDAGTGKILQRAPQTGTGGRPGKWLLNVRRLEASGGPTRQKIDDVVDSIPLQIDDLQDAVRVLRRRVDALERRKAAQGGPIGAATGRSPL